MPNLPTLTCLKATTCGQVVLWLFANETAVEWQVHFDRPADDLSFVSKFNNFEDAMDDYAYHLNCARREYDIRSACAAS